LWCAASLGTPPGTRAVLRQLVFQVSGALADATRERSNVHAPSNYSPSWAHGRKVRALGLDGVHFRSVRQAGGLCLALFEERALTFSRVEFGAVVLEWNGTNSTRLA
jgi:hypothetical protein